MAYTVFGTVLTPKLNIKNPKSIWGTFIYGPCKRMPLGYWLTIQLKKVFIGEEIKKKNN